MLTFHMSFTKAIAVKKSQHYIANEFILVFMLRKGNEIKENNTLSFHSAKKSVLQKEWRYTKAMISFSAIKSRKFPMMKLKLSG